MAIFLDLKGTTQSTVQFGKGGPKIQSSTGDFHFHTPNLADYVDIFANVLRATGNELVLNANAPNSGSNYKYTVKRPTSGMTSQLTLHLPPNYGSSGQFLQSDGAGNTSWASAGGGASGFTELTGPVNLTGTYNGFLRVIGDATVTGNVTVKGDLKVTGSLINPSNYAVSIEGNAELGNFNFSPSIGSDGGSLSVGGDLRTSTVATLAGTGSTSSGLYAQHYLGYVPSEISTNMAGDGTYSGYWDADPNYFADTTGTLHLSGDWTSYLMSGGILYGPGGQKVYISTLTYNSTTLETDITFGYARKLSSSMTGNVASYPLFGLVVSLSTTNVLDDTLTIYTAQSAVDDSYMAALVGGLVYGDDGTGYTVFAAGYDFGQSAYVIVVTNTFASARLRFEPYPPTTSQIFIGYRSFDLETGLIAFDSLISSSDSIQFLAGVYAGANTSIPIISKTIRPDTGIVLNLASAYTPENNGFTSYITCSLNGTFGTSVASVSTTIYSPAGEIFAYDGPFKGQLKTVQYTFLTGSGNCFFQTSAWSSIPANKVAGELTAPPYYSSIVSGSSYLRAGSVVTFTAPSNNVGVTRTVASASGSTFTFSSPLPLPEYASANFSVSNPVADTFRLNQGTSGSVAVVGDYTTSGLNGKGSDGYNAIGISVSVSGNIYGVEGLYPIPLNGMNIYGASNELTTNKAQINLSASGVAGTAKNSGSLSVAGDIKNIGAIFLNGNDVGGNAGSLTAKNVDTYYFTSTGFLSSTPSTKGAGGTINVYGDFRVKAMRVAGAASLSSHSNMNIYGDFISSIEDIPNSAFVTLFWIFFDNCNLTIKGNYLGIPSTRFKGYLNFSSDNTAFVATRFTIGGDAHFPDSQIGVNGLGGGVNVKIAGKISAESITDTAYAPSISMVLRSVGSERVNLDLESGSYTITSYGTYLYINFGSDKASAFVNLYDSPILGSGTFTVGGSAAGNLTIYDFCTLDEPYIELDGLSMSSCTISVRARTSGTPSTVKAVQIKNCVFGSAGYFYGSYQASGGFTSTVGSSGTLARSVIFNNSQSYATTMTDNLAQTGPCNLYLAGVNFLGAVTLTNRAALNITGYIGASTTTSFTSITGKTTLLNYSGSSTASISASIADSIFYNAGTTSAVWKRIQGSTI